MKFYSLILFLSLLSTNIVGQDSLSNKPKFIIKTDIAFPIIGVINKYNAVSLTPELGFHKRHSLQVMVSYKVVIDFGIAEKIFITTPMYKFFLFKKKFCEGFYTGIYANFIQDYLPSDKFYHGVEVKYKYSSLGGGLIFGYQTYIKKHFVIDALLAPGIKQLVGKTDIVGSAKYHDVISAQNPGFYFIAALNIGYKF